jgi:hypothetical protein
MGSNVSVAEVREALQKQREEPASLSSMNGEEEGEEQVSEEFVILFPVMSDEELAQQQERAARVSSLEANKQLVQIMYWLPTRFIFTIMCVSREWEIACRNVIRDRQSLQLSSSYERSSEYSTFSVTVFYKWEKERIMQMMSSLLQMKNLTHIRENFGHTRGGVPKDLLSKVYSQNASTLKDVKCAQLPDDGKVTFSNLKKLECGTFDASSAARLCPRLEDLNIQSCFKSGPHIDAPLAFLKKVDINSTNVPNGFSEFLAKHAATLEDVRCNHLLARSYPKLRGLCTTMPPHGRAFSLPSLRSLGIWGSGLGSRCYAIGVPDQLLQQLTKLSIELTVADYFDEIERIANMRNLTDLWLQIVMGTNSGMLPDLFAKLYNLEKVMILVYNSNENKAAGIQPAKHWASSLFSNCLNLREIELPGVPISDDDLLLASKLTKLSKITLGNNVTHGFTINGIMSLLRGASRDKITAFTIQAEEEFMLQVDAEFEKIGDERSIKFKKGSGFCYLVREPTTSYTIA